MTRYHTMPVNIENMHENMRGGAMGLNKLSRKTSNAMSKANPVTYAFKNKKLVNAMGDVGQFTQNKLLPAVVSTGIPLASTALGGLATMYGGPMAGQMVSGMSQNLMEQYIPDKYQSNNKYIGLLGDAMAQAYDPDPMAMQQLGQKALGTVSKDLNRLTAPKQQGLSIPPAPPRYIPRPPIMYNPDNPYQDLMMQSMKINQSLNPSEQLQPKTDNEDSVYIGSEVDASADNMKLTKPPYKQKEGSVSGLLGAGIKKRGRPKKKMYEEVYEKVEIYKRPPHKKFSHPKNSALDQLIEARELKEMKKAQKLQNKLAKGQIRKLKEMGYYDVLRYDSDSD